MLADEINATAKFSLTSMFDEVISTLSVTERPKSRSCVYELFAGKIWMIKTDQPEYELKPSVTLNGKPVVLRGYRSSIS